MKREEFFDRLFDVINETDSISVSDLTVNFKAKSITIRLEDNSVFCVSLDENAFSINTL